MKIKNNSSLRNTKIAIVFFALLAFIVGISLIFKIINIISASQFDGSRRFTLAITNSSNIEVMSLSPSSKDIAIFKLKNNMKPAEAGRLLGVPIDGFIASGSLDLNQKTDLLLMNTIFNYNIIKTNLTIIDLLRIALLAKTIPKSSISVKIVKDTDGLALDKLVGRLVRDVLIEKDRETIQIINATEVIGLGNRLARLITNMGGNVIIVATSDSSKKKSKISYIDKKTYTIERLRQVLGYETVRETNNAISDITIVIGEDKINILPF